MIPPAVPPPGVEQAASAPLESSTRASGSGLSVDREESRWVIRCEGDVAIASAGELKALLLEGLASGKQLRVNLERAGEIDITALQLLCAARREAGPGPLVPQVPDSLADIAREAGFGQFPGGTAEE